jgi:hypothetical protein
MSGLAFCSGSTQGASFFAWWPLLSALLAAGVAGAKDIGGGYRLVTEQAAFVAP